MKIIVYVMLVFGIILTNVAYGNIEKSDTSYYEIRGNQVFKINKVSKISWLMDTTDNQSVFTTFTFESRIDSLKANVVGDTNIIHRYLTPEMYLKSLVEDSVFVHESIVRLKTQFFPYFCIYASVTSFYLVNLEIVSDTSSIFCYMNHWLLTVIILLLLYVSGVWFSIKSISQFKHIRLVYIFRWTMFWLVYLIFIFWGFNSYFLDCMYLVLLYVYLPVLLFIIFFRRKTYKVKHIITQQIGFVPKLVPILDGEYFDFMDSGRRRLFDVESMKILFPAYLIKDYDLSRGLILIQKIDTGLFGIYDLKNRKMLILALCYGSR